MGATGLIMGPTGLAAGSVSAVKLAGCQDGTDISDHTFDHQMQVHLCVQYVAEKSCNI